MSRIDRLHKRLDSLPPFPGWTHWPVAAGRILLGIMFIFSGLAKVMDAQTLLNTLPLYNVPAWTSRPAGPVPGALRPGGRRAAPPPQLPPRVAPPRPRGRDRGPALGCRRAVLPGRARTAARPHDVEARVPATDPRNLTWISGESLSWRWSASPRGS